MPSSGLSHEPRGDCAPGASYTRLIRWATCARHRCHRRGRVGRRTLRLVRRGVRPCRREPHKAPRRLAQRGPPGLLVFGVGALVMGVWPRAVSISTYAVITWSFLIELIGGFISSNHWLLATSVFHQMASAPAVPPDWTAGGCPHREHLLPSGRSHRGHGFSFAVRLALLGGCKKRLWGPGRLFLRRSRDTWPERIPFPSVSQHAARAPLRVRHRIGTLGMGTCHTDNAT